MSLQRFLKGRKCLKCGGKARSHYCEKSSVVTTCFSEYSGIERHNTPLIHRNCEVCSFEWAELPLDAKG